MSVLSGRSSSWETLSRRVAGARRPIELSIRTPMDDIFVIIAAAMRIMMMSITSTPRANAIYYSRRNSRMAGTRRSHLRRHLPAARADRSPPLASPCAVIKKYHLSTTRSGGSALFVVEIIFMGGKMKIIDMITSDMHSAHSRPPSAAGAFVGDENCNNFHFSGESSLNADNFIFADTKWKIFN